MGFDLLGRFHALHKGQRKEAIHISMAVRSRFFDDFIEGHSSEPTQVVIVAAGMDTRFLRLSVPQEVRYSLPL